jgi:hypothetical protein
VNSLLTHALDRKRERRTGRGRGFVSVISVCLSISSLLGVQLVAQAAGPAARSAAASTRNLAGLAAPGTEKWVKRYNGPANGDDFATAVAVGPHGAKVFVTGGSVGKNGIVDFATIAYSATTGSRLWVTRYYPTQSSGEPVAIVVSPDGSKVFIIGGPLLIAYNASTGARLWVALYSSAGSPFALAMSPDGSKVFVTGYTLDSNGDRVVTTVAFNPKTGAQLWVTYDFGSIGFAIGVSPDGSKVFVTGTVQVPQGLQASDVFMTMAYDASTGTQLWQTLYRGADPNAPTDTYAGTLVVSPDGSTVFVAGSSSGTTNYDYATVAYNATTGAQLWVMRYNGPTSGDDRVAEHGLGLSPDGSKLYVTGTAGLNSSAAEYATLAYNATTGVQLWVQLYNGPANGASSATGLVVSPDGSKVFVTGDSVGSANVDDAATVAYDASTGSSLWVHRLTGPGSGNNDASGIVTGPDGSTVFVAGYGLGLTTGLDFVTVAYSVS